MVCLMPDEAKRQKCEDAQVDEVVNDAIEPTKITDINNDCLQHIFNYLSVVDLLKVCDASKQFHDALELTFKTRRYQTVELKDITVTMTACLKYLRHFGHTIKTLTIDYNRCDQNHSAEVDRYINEYCGDTLEAIHIRNAKSYSMNNLTKCFLAVSTVKFYNCELSHQLTDFEKWCPEMHTLEYHGINTVTDSECFSKRIPRLCDLLIGLIRNEANEYQIGKLKLAKLLQSNPQISSVTINGPGLDAKGLQSISEDLQNVSRLHLFLTRHFFNLSSGTVGLENVTSLRINFDCSITEYPEIPISCHRLERLRIYGRKRLNENFINFLAKQKSLNLLRLSRCKDTISFRNCINDVRLENVLRLLNTLSLDCECCTDEVIRFLQKFNMIKRFHFFLDKNSNLDDLKERLPAEWRVGSFYGRRIYLEFNNGELEP